MKPLALAACGALAVTLGAAHGIGAPRDGCEVEGVWCGPVLTPTLSPEPNHYFRIGLGVEAWDSQFSGSELLVALSTTLRLSAFAPYVQLMMRPGTGTKDYENTRALAGAGLRAYLPIWDRRLSYGLGVLGELRFEEHFWLAYATPIELSAVVYRKGSLDIELFTGARRAFAGNLINSFLLDPNGFENEDAQANLDRARHAEAWHGFIRIMVSRRID